MKKKFSWFLLIFTVPFPLRTYFLRINPTVHHLVIISDLEVKNMVEQINCVFFTSTCHASDDDMLWQVKTSPIFFHHTHTGYSRLHRFPYKSRNISCTHLSCLWLTLMIIFLRPDIVSTGTNIRTTKDFFVPLVIVFRHRIRVVC